MTHRFLAVALVLGIAATACANEEKPEHRNAENGEGEKKEAKEGEHERKDPPDLMLSNFFSAGWKDKFEEHPDEGRAPRFSLFQSRQGFLERVAALKFTETHGLEKKTFDENEPAAELEYAMNRRFELDVEAFNVTQVPQTLEGRSGDDTRFTLGLRFALIDTAWTAWSFEPRVTTRSPALGEPQTELSFAVAGFQDLTRDGLYRTGLYETFEYVDRTGALFAPGTPLPDEIPASRFFRTGLTVAKTWDSRDEHRPLAFTLFLEGLAVEQLDGTNRDRTAFTLTPGIRLSPLNDGRTWIQLGWEIPTSDFRTEDRRYLFALLKDF